MFLVGFQGLSKVLSLSRYETAAVLAIARLTAALIQIVGMELLFIILPMTLVI